VSADNTTELQRLIDQLCAGGAQSPASVDELVGRVYVRTRRLARRIFRVSFPRLGANHETGTVHHEALLRIRRTLNRSQPATVKEFWALSTRIIRNTLIDLARRYDHSPLRRAQSLDATSGSSASGKRALEPAIPQEAPEVVESWTQFHNEVSQLPQPLREVFELCFYNGLSQREAAEILERDPGTVSRLWRRAVAQLPRVDF
jgi:RNA polymerase sigma factor (sigma-70 family)